nr:MAG TPA: hypothetical protein [Caudoviricetes sp.]
MLVTPLGTTNAPDCVKTCIPRGIILPSTLLSTYF